MKLKLNQIRFLMYSFACVFLSTAIYATPNNVDQKLNEASVSFTNKTLVVSTGKVKRTWQLTETGFQTVSYKNSETGKEWCGKKSVYASDWNLPNRIDNETKGELISIDCIETDDERFTANHLWLSLHKWA